MKNNIKQHYDLVVVGAGPAGMTAAIYAKRAECTVVMIDKGPPGGKMVKTSEIENYPGFNTILGPDLSLNMFMQTQQLNVPLIGDEVVLIKQNPHTQQFILELANSETLSAKAVIIATGTVERTVGAKGEAHYYGKGVSYCAVCDGSFYKGEDIMVIGGGYGAFEEGLYLTKFAKTLYLVHRREGFRADATIINQFKSNPKTKMLLNYVLKEVVGNGVVKGVVLENTLTHETKKVAVKAVFPYIGADPAVALLEGLPVLDALKYLVVGPDGQSKVPGLFGAGDVTNTNFRQIATAVSDGARAAQFTIKYLDELKAKA